MAHLAVSLVEMLDRLDGRLDVSRFWAPDEARREINEALRWWNLFTGTWYKTVVLLTTAADPYVTLGADTLLYRTAVRWQDAPALRRSSLAELNLMQKGWLGETTTDGDPVPDAPKVWAPNGLTEFAIWPADAVGSQQLIVEGVSDTPQLVGEGDFIDISEAELAVLLGEVVHLLAFKLGGERFQATQRLHQAFLRGALDKNDRLGASIPFRRAAGLDTGRAEQPRRQFPRAAAKVQAALGGGGQR